MKVFITSDTFFGRELAAVNGGFKSSEEMEDAIINNWNNKVGPEDIVYHLGNFGWDPISSESAIIHLNGNINFIGGEYDKHMSEISLVKVGRHKLLPPIVEIPDLDIVLSHWPLSNWSGKDDGVIHIHGGDKQDNMKNRYCVNIKNWNWNPTDLDFLIEISQNDNNLK